MVLVTALARSRAMVVFCALQAAFHIAVTRAEQSAEQSAHATLSPALAADDSCSSNNDNACASALLHLRGELKLAVKEEKASAKKRAQPDTEAGDDEVTQESDELVAKLMMDARAGIRPVHGGFLPVFMPSANFTVVGLMHAKLVEFLGVPYAAPPILDLRWRSPLPFTPPTRGFLDATRPKPNCLQIENPTYAFGHPEWGSTGAWPTLASGPLESKRSAEDCLYLNIFAPRSGVVKPQHGRKKLRPVLVYIPGGVGFYGGANDQQLDGQELAVKGDVVVVVGNYRLGIFGYTWSEMLEDRIDAPSSMPLAQQDQQQLLVWVKHNIRAFGGDHKKVTLAGESSAALDVLAHITRPKSTRKFFHRAMMSSPPETFDTADSERLGETSEDDAVEMEQNKVFRELAKHHGCINIDDGKPNVECLLKVPGEYLDPKGQFTAGKSRKFNRKLGHMRVPVLMGFTRDEASAWWYEGYTQPSLQSTRQDFLDWANLNYHGYGPKVAATYQDAKIPADADSNTSDAYRTASEVVLDHHHVCPTFATANFFRERSMDTFVWRFDQVPKKRKVLCSGVTCDGTETDSSFVSVGSCHGCDVPFWFGQKSLLEDGKEMEVANAMTEYFVNFIHTGNPNRGLDGTSPKVHWPVATKKHGHVKWHSWGPKAPPRGSLMCFGGIHGVATVEVQHLAKRCPIWEEFGDMEASRPAELDLSYWIILGLSSFVTSLAVAATCARKTFYVCAGPSQPSVFCCDGWKRYSPQGSGTSTPTTPGASSLEGQLPSEASNAIEEISAISLLVGPTEAYPAEQSVSELFQRCAEEHPSAVALELPVGPAETRTVVSYGVLQKRVGVVAEALHNAGGKQKQMMAMMVERGAHLVVGVLGILRLGAAWAAVDVGAPKERQLKLLQALRASVVLTEVGASVPQAAGLSFAVVQLTPEGVPNQVFQSSAPLPVPATAPEEVAYPAMVVFTSGSTGEPKGVVYTKEMLTHGSWFYGSLSGQGADHRTLLKSPHIWAVIEYELFSPIIRGATLLVARPGGHKDPAYLASLLLEEGLDSLMITPRVLRAVLDVLRKRSGSKGASPMRLKNCTCVGEALPVDLVDEFHEICADLAPGAYLHNLYGASEASCTVWTSSPQSHRPGSISGVNAPAGSPQPHAVVYLLKRPEVEGSEGVRSTASARCARPVLRGEVGEIFFGGIMAAGYLGRHTETAASFVEVEGIPGRLYATGDLGRLVNGQLEVLGRRDAQLNISGIRIEPGEVEAVLHRCPGVQEAAIVGAGEPARLVALCVPGGHATDAEQLKSLCSKQLPGYMVPSIVLWLDKFPLLPNGKRDMKVLKEQAKSAVAEYEDENGVMEQVDSLGIVRKQSPEARRWQQATWVCYAYWSYGVIVDHWMKCNQKSWSCDTILWLMPNWVELIVRSVGNVQDLCGFLMLGAHQDANDTPEARCSLGRRELFAWLMHLLVYALIPIMDLITPWQSGYPNYEAANIHRWYLWMYVLARILLWLFTQLRIMPVMQVAIVFLASQVCPKEGILNLCVTTRTGTFLHALGYFLFPSYCDTPDQPIGASAVKTIISSINSDGCTCPVTGQTELLYMAMYLAFFHGDFLIKRLPKMAPVLLLATVEFSGLAGLYAAFKGRLHETVHAEDVSADISLAIMLVLAVLLTGAVNYVLWPRSKAEEVRIPSIVLLAASLLSQVTVATFFYPMESLESGHAQLVQTPLEIGLCVLQPAVFFVAVLQLGEGADKERGPQRSRMATWAMTAVEQVGRSALGSYLFHYFFTPTATSLIMHGASSMNAPGVPFLLGGLLQLLWALFVPAVFLFCMAPLFQGMLTAPVRLLASAGSK